MLRWVRQSKAPTHPVQGALHTGSREVQAHDGIAGLRGTRRQASALHLGQSQVLLCFPGHKGNNVFMKTLFQKLAQRFGKQQMQPGDFILSPTPVHIYRAGNATGSLWGGWSSPTPDGTMLQDFQAKVSPSIPHPPTTLHPSFHWGTNVNYHVGWQVTPDVLPFTPSPKSVVLKL